MRDARFAEPEVCGPVDDLFKPEALAALRARIDPRRARLRALWRVHTKLGLPLLGRLVSTAWYDVGRFLGPNIEQFHDTQPDLTAVWNAAGIGQVTQRRMSFGAGLVMWGVTDGHNT